MPNPTNPSEITREVLRLFAARRLQPTPDNFRALYHEIAGTDNEGDRFPTRYIRAVAERLPRDTAEQNRLARQLDQALVEDDVETAEQSLFAQLDSLKKDEVPAWNTLIGKLLRQWEGRQLGWTTARKRESLERVLTSNDAATLYTRLQGLVRAWNQAPSDPEASTHNNDAAADEATPAGSISLDTKTQQPAGGQVTFVAPGDAGDVIASLREILLLAFETVIPATLADEPELKREAAALAASVKSAASADQLRTIGKQLRKFAYRLERSAGDTAEVRAGLLNLLRLLLENIEEIVIDDDWLHGQIEVLRDIVNKPANVRLIDDAERRLKEVIYKQSQLKHNLVNAQNHLRKMLAGFVDQLASFSERTSTYHDQIAANASKIAAARDITEIEPLLNEVMRDTRIIQEEARRSRDELHAARDQARLAEQQIAQLQHDLDEASRLMRHDQLTGVLNRRGLEDTFEKEAARAIRRDCPLCIGLLDIDNFKRLNDTFGHQTGDDALVHLANIIRENLRPTDSVSRIGGEEFVILYPDSDLEQSTAALIRLQRELTRNFFLADERKVLITFSAGVSPWAAGEPLDAVIKRADAAMYEAKQTGKNKVITRPIPATPG